MEHIRHDSSSRGVSSKQSSSLARDVAVTQRLTAHTEQNDAITAKFGQRNKLSQVRKVLFVVLTIAIILMLAAFFSNYWLVSDNRYYGSKFNKLGLWRMCFRSFSSPVDYEYKKFYVGCRWIFADEYKYIRSYLMPGSFRHFQCTNFASYIQERLSAWSLPISTLRSRFHFI